MSDDTVCESCMYAHQLLTDAGMGDGDLADKIGDLVAARDEALEQAKIKVQGSRANLEPYQSLVHVSVLNFAQAMRRYPYGLESLGLGECVSALVGEVSQACALSMNVERVGSRFSIASELIVSIGEVFLKLDLFARVLGLKTEDCIRKAFNQASERDGFPERL